MAAACAAAAASSSSSSPRPSVRSPVGGSQSGAGTLRRAAAGFNDFWGEPFSARPRERESETEGSKDIEASFGPEEAEERKRNGESERERRKGEGCCTVIILRRWKGVYSDGEGGWA